MSVELRPTPGFMKAYKRLSLDLQKAVTDALEMFMRHPKLPSLRYRPLQGRAGHFIINATRGDRIILRQTAADHYDLVDVGPHDLYRRWNR